jgi:hypothetical protein
MYTHIPGNTIIIMISLYSQDKENVTIFETLKLFTQYILQPYIHIYIYIYSISPAIRVSMDLYVMAMYIHYFIHLSREMKKKEKKRIHGRSF